jgi:hypothetical protein
MIMEENLTKAEAGAMSSKKPRLTCPDGGTCHHECAAQCFRVQACGPLTAAGFEGNQWPAAVRALHQPGGVVEHGMAAGAAVRACCQVLDKAAQMLYSTAESIRRNMP